MDLLAEAARLAEVSTLEGTVSQETSTYPDTNPSVQHREDEANLGNCTVEASEEEQISYLRELLEHQVQLCMRLEEECALLSSFLLRSQFKNLTETAFYSAVRKKNVHPDELGKVIEAPKVEKESGKRTSSDSTSDAGTSSAKKPRVGDSGRSLKEGADGRGKGKVKVKKDTANNSAKDHNDKGSGAPSAVGPSTRSPSPVKSPMTAQQLAHQNLLALAAEKARLVANRKASAVRRVAESKKKALQAAALMKPPSDTAGEEARLLGEKILQRLATSGSVVATKAMLTEDDDEVRRRAEAARQQQSQATTSQQALDCNLPDSQKEAVSQEQNSA